MSSPVHSFFGRAWKVTVLLQALGGTPWTATASTSTSGTESLRATFSIEQTAMQSYWFADITIYNVAPSTQQLIQKGDAVTVEAGYLSPGSGLIFQGKVFQPIWERENATDFKLTLHCFIGHFEDENGWAVTTVAAGTTQAQAVRQIAAAAQIPYTVDYLDPVLNSKPYPKGFAWSGPARAYFNGVAIDNHLQIWVGWTGLSISSLAPQGDVPDRVFAPPLSPGSSIASNEGITQYTLIGSPQQTQQGVAFRVLLDSSLRLGLLVKLDMAVFNKLASVPGQLPLLVDKDGLYVVASIRHTGDTRGNEWYSEVVAVTREFSKLHGIALR